MENLIERILKFYQDYDLYEYNDTFENDEAAAQHIQAMLAMPENITSLIKFCDDILESENYHMYQEASKIKYILMQKLKILKKEN